MYLYNFIFELEEKFLAKLEYLIYVLVFSIFNKSISTFYKG